MRYKSSNHCDMCVFVVCVCVWRERANLIMAKVWLASRQKQAREPHAYFDGCPTRFAPAPPPAPGGIAAHFLGFSHLSGAADNPEVHAHSIPLCTHILYSTYTHTDQSHTLNMRVYNSPPTTPPPLAGGFSVRI